MTLNLAPDIDGIATAAEILKTGGTVGFPTETVYGLGGDATNPHAVAAIFQAKGRPAFNPLIAHVADHEAAQREGVFDAATMRLAEAFWPGPLTMVVPRRAGGTVCDLACAGLASVGLRCPDHPVALDLLRAFGRPVAGPSANRSGHVSPTAAAHVLGDLSGRIDAVLDGGATRVGIESTIVGAINGQLMLLRPGFITREAIEQVSGVRLVSAAEDVNAPISPGRLLAHYAPKTPVRLNVNSVLPGEALLKFGPAPVPGEAQAACVLNLSEGGHLSEAAAALYAMLRELDRVGASAIAVSPLPRHDLGEAILDRLARAAAASTFCE